MIKPYLAFRSKSSFLNSSRSKNSPQLIFKVVIGSSGKRISTIQPTDEFRHNSTVPFSSLSFIDFSSLMAEWKTCFNSSFSVTSVTFEFSTWYWATISANASDTGLPEGKNTVRTFPEWKSCEWHSSSCSNIYFYSIFFLYKLERARS